MNSEKAVTVLNRTTLSAKPPLRNENISMKEAMVICITLGISGTPDIFYQSLRAQAYDLFSFYVRIRNYGGNYYSIKEKDTVH